ncbi:hypothetical protein PR048_000307 [Dryococelus australis]|uniref:Uncharacterized protein n=1 Tax=Dryococelus australis TaxID=614101 RepID=A0ABQ9IGJ0_9NEOP|nr:hypothetical protein PR048_000307 [Dryococelus australis]
MATTSQKDFLFNKNNKVHLIAMLTLRLVDADVRVVQAKVKLPLRSTWSNGNAKILHRSTSITSAALYDIDAIQNNIGDMQSAVLFVHDFTRSDKTSRLLLYNRTVDRQALSASFEIAVLPPTKAVLYQHSLRTHLQADPTVYV